MNRVTCWPVVIGLILASPSLRSQEATTDLEAELNALLNTKVEVASKSAERLSDAPGIISVLSKDDLQRFGGTTLADVLNRVPGLLHVSNYFTDRSIMGSRGDSLRATCTNRHVLVLFDGRPVREVQEGGIKSDVYETFPVAAIDHIEVIKGPGSVLYGSEAYSGVINVVTDKSKETGGSLLASVGQDGAHKHAAKLNVASGDFSLLVAAQKTKRPDWPVRYTHTRLPSGPPAVDGTREKTFLDSGLGAFIKAKYQNFQITGSFHNWKPTYVIPDQLLQPPLTPLDPGNLELKKNFLDVGYLFDFTSHWKMSLNATYNHSQFECLEATFPNIKRDNNEMLGEMTHFITFSDKAKLTLGGLYSKVTGKEEMKFPYQIVSDGSRNGYAVYGQFDYQFVENVKGIAGFQTLKIGEAETKTVPRVGVIWYPSKRVNVKLLYGEAFRAPYINEVLADFPGLKGTATLKPELVKAFEAGVTYLGDTVELGVSGFRNHQTNLIAYRMLNLSDGRPTYINEGETTIQGFEFEAKYYINRTFYMVGSVLTQRSQDKPTGIADQGAKFGISASGEVGVLSLFAVYQGDVPEELHNRLSPNPQPGSYTLLSLHGEWNLSRTFGWGNKPQVKLTLQGDNLLDKEIWVNALGDQWPQETIPFKKGRNVYVGLSVVF